MRTACGTPLVFLYLLLFVSSFKWHLTDVLPAKKILTFSERYMFATQNGPTMLEQGDAYIDVHTDVIAYMLVNRTSMVGYAVYASADKHHHDTLEGLCGEPDIRINEWAQNVYASRVPTRYLDEVNIPHPTPDLVQNGTYYRWVATLSTRYTINVEAWHNVAFQLCSTEQTGPMAKVDGTVTFRNPYGFIPAELYGFLPFEGARMVAYFLFACFYLFMYFKHRSSTLPLHHATLVVFLFAMVEATTWYAAYQTINLTGEPYCCPFPPTVVASLVLQVFRQTFSRMLLLVVSLGYGIVRPRLLPAEWIAIVVVSVLYFITAVIAQVSEIIIVHDIHGDSPDSALGYQLPGLFMDVIFLAWVYIALGSTIRILTEFQQSHKLAMFKQLAFTIALFVTLFSIVTVLVLLDKSSILSWPWQWAWAQQVLWEVLNFAVISAVCIVCLPSDNSRLLSYASQLPTEDPDDEESDLSGKEEIGRPDELEEAEGEGEGGGIQLSNIPHPSHFSSLPEADNEFGLEED